MVHMREDNDVFKHIITPRLMGLGAIGLSAALVLTGCGRADDAGSDVEVGSIDSSPATGDIEVWAAGDFGVQAADLFDAFEANNDGVTVTVTDVPWSEINSKVTNAIAAGTGPDLVLIGDVAQLIPTGGIQPVPDGVFEDAALYENALLRSQDQNGLQYGVPWYLEARILWYNTALADAAGVSAPTTWDEQIEFFQALSEIDSVSTAVGMPVGHADYAYQAIMPLFAQAGGSALTEDSTTWDLGSDAMVEALTYYKSFFDLGLSSADGMSDSAVQNFVSGTTAATFQGSYLASALDAAIGVEGFSASTYSAAVRASGTANNAAYLGGATWVVPTDADNSDAAWKLVKWLVEDEQQVQMFQITNNLPSATATWTDPDVVIADFVQTGIDQMDSTISDVPVPSWAEVLTVIDNESEKVVRGEATPEEAAAAIQQQAEGIGLGW